MIDPAELKHFIAQTYQNAKRGEAKLESYLFLHPTTSKREELAELRGFLRALALINTKIEELNGQLELPISGAV